MRILPGAADENPPGYVRATLFFESCSKENAMKIPTIMLAGAFALLTGAVLAQSNSSEKTQKSTTGDPAASTANPNPDTTGRGGSGTSSSGGKDDNGDQGRDKMPDSNMAVRPSLGKPDIPNAANRQ